MRFLHSRRLPGRGVTVIGTIVESYQRFSRLHGGRVMDTNSFVLDQNISHYREQLKSEADPAKQKILAELLAEANAELAHLLNTPTTRDFETAGQ